MITATNQDGVLAEFRRDSSRNDPEFYSAQFRHGAVFVWMSVIGNVGWYRPVIRDGEMTGIQPESLPWDDDDPALNFYFKWINPKQRRKLVAIVSALSKE